MAVLYAFSFRQLNFSYAIHPTHFLKKEVMVADTTCHHVPSWDGARQSRREGRHPRVAQDAAAKGVCSVGRLGCGR